MSKRPEPEIYSDLIVLINNHFCTARSTDPTASRQLRVYEDLYKRDHY